MTKKSDFKSKAKLARAEAKFGKLIRINWVPSMSVGSAKIDSQHKVILMQINNLQDKMIEGLKISDIRSCFHTLDRYIDIHFTYEEDYMEKNGYPDLEKHRKDHLRFIGMYEKLRGDFAIKLSKPVNTKKVIEEFLKKIREFMLDWWVDHIQGVDMEYCRYITPEKCISKK